MKVLVKIYIIKIAILLCIIIPTSHLVGQNAPESQKITFLYTGKSFGALGNIRFQKEHELLTAQALIDSIDFKLVSHACWRTKGVTIFLPSDEPEGQELAQIMSQKEEWQHLQALPALRSENVILFQDPDRMTIDMIEMMLRNKNSQREFPDFEIVHVNISKTYIGEGMEVFIVEEEGSIWPDQLGDWDLGEINRLDFGKKSRLFELPINFGSIGVRSTVLQQIQKDSTLYNSDIIKVDLGHRVGDFNISSEDRIRIDYRALTELGYKYVVPNAFELSVNATTLKELKAQTPEIQYIATNVASKPEDIFEKFEIYKVNNVKIGIIGLVDPDIKLNQSKNLLNDFVFSDPIKSAESSIKQLQKENVDLIIAFSNMGAENNALISEHIKGIHVIASNLSNDGIPYPNPYTIDITKFKSRRLGRPHMITKSFDYGMAIGRLDLKFTFPSAEKSKVELAPSISSSTYSSIELGSINYKHPDSLFTKENIIRLDEIVTLTKNHPLVNIEIVSHVSTPLSSSHNLYSSIKRGEIISDYLIDQGVNKEKINIKGYGNQLIYDAHSSDDQMGRIEIKLHKNGDQSKKLQKLSNKEIVENLIPKYRKYKELTNDKLSYKIEIAKSQQRLEINRIGDYDFVIEKIKDSHHYSYMIGSYGSYNEAVSIFESLSNNKAFKIIPFVNNVRISDEEITNYVREYPDLNLFLQKPELSSIGHRLYSVNDRIESDTALMRKLMSEVKLVSKPKGDLMFPAFIDIIEQEPSLQSFDETTRQGRVSKGMWEGFMTRLMRINIPAEISIMRPLPSFAPLIGKLHEREVRSWLWFEDEIVLCDMKGADIKRLLNSPSGQPLVSSGIGSRGRSWSVMGRSMLDGAYYRVATTDVIFDGVLSEYFHRALRVNKKFSYTETGTLKNDEEGQRILLKTYISDELKRIRSYGKGKEHRERIISYLLPDKPYEKLFTFNFLQPTLWTSLSRSYKGDGYSAVPESRVNADNSFVIGVNGGMVLTQDGLKSAWDAGLKFGFARQSAESETGIIKTTENADDIVLSLTYRYKGAINNKNQPFARLEYDSEFTPTFNPDTDANNLRQKILRGLLGINKRSSFRWPILEIGITVENDFSNRNYQYGLQGRSQGRFRLEKKSRALYSMTNNFNYYLPSSDDSLRDLSFKVNSIHEILVPLFGDLSLSVGADIFFFRGKLDANNKPGMSMLYRVGVSYNRLWKPKFQSLL